MKINVFKSLSDNISKLFGKKNNPTTPEEKMITEKFMEFLEVEDCVFCYKMMEEGFEPNNNLKKQLNDLLLQKINKKAYSYNEIVQIKNVDAIIKIKALLTNLDVHTNHYDFFNSYPNMYKSHSQEDIVSLFKDDKDKQVFIQYFKDYIEEFKAYYKDGLDSFKDFMKIRDEGSIKYNNNLLYVTGVLIRHHILDTEDIQEIKNIVKGLDSFLNNHTGEAFKNKSFSRIEKIYFDSFLEKLTQFQSQQLGTNNNKENVIRQIKSFKARQKTLTEEINHLVVNEEYSVENLPLEAKNKVKYITDLVNKANNEEISHFVQLRLPVILKKYFSIDEEYRTNLTNVEGFNAEQLMNQSLDNIEKIVKAKQEDNNYDLLSELSIENRKLKAKV